MTGDNPTFPSRRDFQTFPQTKAPRATRPSPTNEHEGERAGGVRGFPRGGSPVAHPRQAAPTRGPRQSPEPAAPGGRADAAQRQAQRLEAEPVLQQEPAASSRHGDPAGRRRRAKAGEKGERPRPRPRRRPLPPRVRAGRAGRRRGPLMLRPSLPLHQRFWKLLGPGFFSRKAWRTLRGRLAA